MKALMSFSMKCFQFTYFANIIFRRTLYVFTFMLQYFFRAKDPIYGAYKMAI